ncbi:MAG: AI-2E family transporter [Actinobacteria bacterium]|jgi:predicted PurR-regulated permease PerM|nr:AI-2E family transporter [Actinomycetota bacterium]
MSSAGDAVAGGRGPGGDLGFGPKLLLVLGATVLVMAGLREIGNLIGPVFLALTLAVAVRPIGHWLRARGVRSGLSTVLVLLVLYVLLFGMLAVLGLAVSQLVGTLPDYADQFTTLTQSVLGWLSDHGIHQDALDRARSEVSVGTLVGVAQGLLSSLTSGASLVLFLLLSVAFLVIDTAGLEGRAAMVRRAQPHLSAALEDFSHRVRRYWGFSALFGLVLAVADYLALLVLGVPLALTWAVVAFICNFVPNVGFVLALVPPAILALLSGGPWLALGVVVSYMVISFVVQTLLLPKFMGDAVGLNTTTTFMSLVFWTGIIGALGALLAIPLTLLVKALVIDSTPSLRWLGAFVSSADSAARVEGSSGP